LTEVEFVRIQLLLTMLLFSMQLRLWEVVVDRGLELVTAVEVDLEHLVDAFLATSEIFLSLLYESQGMTCLMTRAASTNSHRNPQERHHA